MSTGTNAEQMAPFRTDSTTSSSLVYFIIMGSVVSSLVAPAAAMQAAHDPQMAETARRMAESGGLNGLFGRQK